MNWAFSLFILDIIQSLAKRGSKIEFRAQPNGISAQKRISPRHKRGKLNKLVCGRSVINLSHDTFPLFSIIGRISTPLWISRPREGRLSPSLHIRDMDAKLTLIALNPD